MKKEDFLDLIRHPERLNDETLPAIKELAKQHPYFHTATLLYLRNLKNRDDLSYYSELKKAAISVPDRARLEKLMETKVEKLEHETSVATYNVENDAPRLRRQDLIDRFIIEKPHIKPVGDAPVTEMPENVSNDETNVTDSIFTESLAKIYIKQGQYSKAIRIFEKLNLKYPEKSSYFADQISFLKKIIENR